MGGKSSVCKVFSHKRAANPFVCSQPAAVRRLGAETHWHGRVGKNPRAKILLFAFAGKTLQLEEKVYLSANWKVVPVDIRTGPGLTLLFFMR